MRNLINSQKIKEMLMSDSKENALLYYSGFLALREKLDFMRARRALENIFGQSSVQPAVALYENSIAFFDGFKEKSVGLSKGVFYHGYEKYELQGQEKQKIISKLDEIYRNIVEKTIFYNYSENDTVRKAFEKALLSETLRFLPLNVEDIIQNKDLERAAIFLFLSNLSRAPEITLSDTALIHGMTNGFGLHQLFSSTLAAQGCLESMVLIDHSFVKGDSYGPYVQNNALRLGLTGAGVLASILVMVNANLMSTSMAFVSSLALTLSSVIWENRKIRKQAGSIKEQTTGLSFVMRSVLEKSYLISDERSASVLYAQERALARLKRVKYYQEIALFVRDAIANKLETQEKINVFDVLTQKEDLAEIHQEAFHGVPVSKLLKKYSQENVYQWMLAVNMLYDLAHTYISQPNGYSQSDEDPRFEKLRRKAFSEAFIGGLKKLPTKSAMAIAIHAYSEQENEMKPLRLECGEIKDERKNVLKDMLQWDNERIKITQQCFNDFDTLLKEQPYITSKEVWDALYKKWILNGSEHPDSNMVVFRCENTDNKGVTNIVLKLSVCRKMLEAISKQPLHIIYNYVDELGLSLKNFERYKELSRKKQLTVDEFIETEADDFNDFDPYRYRPAKPLKIHPKTIKMLKRAQMLDHLRTKANN